MPTALALLSVEQGGKPLLVAPTSGIVLGSATAVLQEFVAHVGLDAVGRDAGELRLDSSWVVVHYKLLAGSAVLAAVLCETWENPYEGKEALSDLEAVGQCVYFCSSPSNSIPLASHCVATPLA